MNLGCNSNIKKGDFFINVFEPWCVIKMYDVKQNEFFFNFQKKILSSKYIYINTYTHMQLQERKKTKVQIHF